MVKLGITISKIKDGLVVMAQQLFDNPHSTTIPVMLNHQCVVIDTFVNCQSELETLFIATLPPRQVSN